MNTASNCDIVIDITKKMNKSDILTKMRITALEYISKIEGVIQPISIMDGDITTILKKDMFVMVWSTTDSDVYHADVYQTKEEIQKGYIYNSSILQNKMLFRITTKMQNDADEKKAENIELYTGEDIQNFKNKYEMVMNDLKRHVLQELVSIVDASVRDLIKENAVNLPKHSKIGMVQEETQISSKEQAQQPSNHTTINKPCENIIKVDYSGLVAELSKFDRKKLKSKEERDKLLSKKYV